MSTVLVPRPIVAECLAEADRTYPDETGGAFLGWWADAATCVVTEVIGPGPGAEHRPWSFQPDQDWQLREIARRYQASGRRLSYLGDWHTHPRAQNGTLSRTDRRTIRAIIETPEARCAQPIMIVWFGQPNGWKPAPWLGRLQRRFLGKRVVLNSMEMIDA